MDKDVLLKFVAMAETLQDNLMILLANMEELEFRLSKLQDLEDRLTIIEQLIEAAQNEDKTKS
jgi:hypothetical protein